MFEDVKFLQSLPDFPLYAGQKYRKYGGFGIEQIAIIPPFNFIKWLFHFLFHKKYNLLFSSQIATTRSGLASVKMVCQ